MKERRLSKLNSFIREEVATLLQRNIKDPRIGFVTVLRVEVTKDCQFADIYISVLGTDSQKRTSMRALEDCSGHLSCEIGKKLDIRNTPKCRFVLDESVEKQIRIEKLIQDAIEDTRRNEEIRKTNQQNSSEEAKT